MELHFNSEDVFNQYYMEFNEEIKVKNIDVLKSRSRLFRKILCELDNIDDYLINVDCHIDFYMNELPPLVKQSKIIVNNRYLVKDLGDKSKTVYDFKHEYALRFLIVQFDYYGCDELQEGLVHLISETPEKYLPKLMDYLNELSECSDIIKNFVEKVTSAKQSWNNNDMMG